MSVSSVVDSNSWNPGFFNQGIPSCGEVAMVQWCSLVCTADQVQIRAVIITEECLFLFLIPLHLFQYID
ncbi:hypothetical protein C7445_1311 [Alicyclobacillus sacchari]|uniref:Uncharacterized protein n=1 Tax=Alicyclobacillus sacchari TaxID=392010 RepID=A0A4R8LA74_9BACL|nr:hypothetical protein C7445_1311 [Alicyclobacillus sacchari]